MEDEKQYGGRDTREVTRGAMAALRRQLTQATTALEAAKAKSEDRRLKLVEMARLYDWLLAERDRLREVVEKYPLTFDGVPVFPEMQVWGDQLVPARVSFVGNANLILRRGSDQTITAIIASRDACSSRDAAATRAATGDGEGEA